MASIATVQSTRALSAALEAERAGLTRQIITSFQTWKQGDEYGHYLFGKDSAYAKPDVDGVPYQLRHVHMVPLADREQLKRWNTDWQRKSRKTSDRVLVYAERRAGSATSYLLIFILPEPEAHLIAGMTTREHRELMDGFANVAAAFIENGNVIA